MPSLIKGINTNMIIATDNNVATNFPSIEETPKAGQAVSFGQHGLTSMEPQGYASATQTISHVMEAGFPEQTNKERLTIVTAQKRGSEDVVLNQEATPSKRDFMLLNNINMSHRNQVHKSDIYADDVEENRGLKYYKLGKSVQNIFKD